MKRWLYAVLLALVPTPGLAAWGSVGSILTSNDRTAATSWGPTTSAQLDAGNVGVCVFATDETGTGTTDGDNAQHTGVTDAAGNTWVKAKEFANMQTSTAADGANVSIWYTLVTTNLTSGAAITISFSASTTAKAAACWEFTVSAGVSLSVAAGATTVADDAADPSSLSDATGVNREHLFIRGTACETGDTTYTADADYTTFTHTSSTQVAALMGARGEFRIATESTSAASDPTWVAADCASAIVGLDADALHKPRKTLLGAGH